METQLVRPNKDQPSLAHSSSAWTVNSLSGLTDLLWVSSFLAVVLDKVHEAVHHSFHCYQSLLKLLPSGRRSICGKRNGFLLFIDLRPIRAVSAELLL